MVALRTYRRWIVTEVLMSVSLRFYLFADDGLQRISQRVMEGLCHGRDAMPQFAKTKQRVANVVVELENGNRPDFGKQPGPSCILTTKGKSTNL